MMNNNIVNGWEIVEKGANNGQHILRLVVDGNEVERLHSGSLKYLSAIADGQYKSYFNRHTKSDFRYAVRGAL